MSKLGKKLFIVFLLLIFFTLALVGIIINYSIGESFNDFINLQREESINELSSLLSERLPDISQVSLNQILTNFSRTNRIQIVLLNQAGNIIYPANSMRRMHSMMGNGNMGMMPEDNFSDELQLKQQLNYDLFAKKEIIIQGEPVATILWQKFASPAGLNNDLYSYFKNKVYQAILFSALIVIVLFLIIAFFLSKRITKPLLNLKNAVLKVAAGDYQQKLTANSNDELAELITAFNQMTTKLANLEKIRKDSTSDLSHELRTPVTTLLGYLEALEDQKITLNSQTIVEMKEEINRMNHLIKQMKNFADAQNRTFNLKKEKVNLNKILENVALKLDKEIKAKNLQIKFDLAADAFTLADQDSIYQIFYNIIQNAVKYNEFSGEIKLKTMVRTDIIVVEIKDTGIGIPESEMPFIFERFYRADKSRNSKNKGTGIGLAVAKELLMAHGAKIEVKSRQKGTAFRLEIPRK